MADFSVTPVGQTIKPPQGMSLGDMVNIARGTQAYKQAEEYNPLVIQQQRQEVEKGGIELSQQRQANKERLNVQMLMQTEPERIMTDGRIDVDKLNVVLPQIAPSTHDIYNAKFTTIAKAQNDTRDAIQSLDQKQISRVASVLDTLGYAGEEDPKKYIDHLERVKKNNPNNVDLHKLVDSSITMFKESNAGKHIPQAALVAGQQLLSPETKADIFRPTYKLENGQVIETKPSVVGSAGNINIKAPTGVAPQLPTTEVNGVKYFIQPPTKANGVPTLIPVGSQGTPQQGSLPSVAAPPPPSAQPPSVQGKKPLILEDMPVANNNVLQLNTQQKDRYDVGRGLVKESQQAGDIASESQDTSREIRKYLEKASGTKPGQIIRQAGKLVFGDPELEKLTKNLADQQIRATQLMGAGTDQSKSDVAKMTGSTEITAEALRSIMDRVDANNTAVKAYQKGLSTYSQSGVNGLIHADRFKQAWKDNYDVRLFRAMNIDRSDLSKDQKEAERRKFLSGMSQQQIKDLQEKANNIERLERGEVK